LQFAICLLTFASALFLVGCERGTSAAKVERAGPEAAVLVSVTPVRTQRVQRTVELVGTLHANEEVTVSSELDGRVAAIRSDVGDGVAAGQVLARIQDEEFRLAVEQLEGSLKETLARLGLEKIPPPDFDATKTSSVLRARAELDDAHVNLKRMKSLYDEKVISAQEYDTAETRYKTLMAAHRASVEEARALIANAYSKGAQLGAAMKKLSDTVIRAPLAGSVSKRFVSAGEYVKIGARLFTIVQDHPLKLRGMVPERFAPDIRAGQAVEVRVDPFPDKRYTGKLARISPSSEVESRSFFVEGLVDNPLRLLKPGFFARASVLTRVDPSALTLPQSSLVTFAGITKVFVIENDVARERVVRTGVKVGSNEVEITAGLKPGELVAISGLTRLTDGAAVRVSGPVMPRKNSQ